MMRDDILKKRMRAGMPVPTPLFAGRVRQTLDRLPERKKASVLRFVPAAAMAVVAVAVIGLAVASRVNPGGMSNLFQALAGGEATATAEKMPTPTSEDLQTAAETCLETVIPTKTPMKPVVVTPESTPMQETPLLTNAPPQLTPEALTAAGADASALLKGQVVPIPSGTKLDFDQDGDLETLTFSSDDDSMVLYIQDGTKMYSWAIDCINPVNAPYVSDIDITDGMLDLIVRENGTDGNWAMYVAGYRQGSFQDRGKIPGWATSPDGNGNVPTDRRMDILMPWSDPVVYRLDNAGKLVLVPKNSYSFRGLELFTLVDIPLLSSRDATSKVAFTVPARTLVTLWSTDNKEWIEIRTKQGTGWLHMDDLITLTDPHIPSYEAFDGIIKAD